MLDHLIDPDDPEEDQRRKWNKFTRHLFQGASELDIDPSDALEHEWELFIERKGK